MIIGSPSTTENEDESEMVDGQHCAEHNQVKMDAKRTVSRFSKDLHNVSRETIVAELVDLVCAVLVKHPDLHYYQGYHDICLTLQLVREHSPPENLKDFNIIKMLDAITCTHLRDYMEPTMEKTIGVLKNLVPLVDVVNEELGVHLYRSGVGEIFALSWLITWFAHVINDVDILARLYDLFLSSHKLMPLYVAASVVCLRANEILVQDADMPIIHKLLTKIPASLTSEEIESVVADSCALFDAYPPDCLSRLHDACMVKRSTLDRAEKLKEIERAVKEIQDKHKPKLELLKKIAFYGVSFGLGAAATILVYNQVRQNPDIGLNDFLSLIHR